MSYEFDENFDVIVVGAGHAGVEASLAAARMGCKVLLATINLEMLAFMPSFYWGICQGDCCP